jgi:hypothetical protein
MWLAAEHGMFLRHTKGEWMTTMPENLCMDWVDSVKVHVLMKIVFFWARNLHEFLSDFNFMTSDACLKYQHVFEYFTERTPRSHFELRETSLVWNYKYAGTRKYIRPYLLPLRLVYFILVKVFVIMLSFFSFFFSVLLIHLLL